MPPPNAPTTARVVLTVTKDVRQFINVTHMRRGDHAVLNAADVLAMANVIADWWQNSYRHSCSPGVVGLSVVATKQDPGDPQQATVYINGPGDQPGFADEAANVTGAISWRTGLAGRKYRGRFYHFGPNGGQRNANDSFTGSWLTLATGVANYLIAHAISAAMEVIIFHRGDNTATTVNQTIVDQLVDSQRRRLAGRGQ
jgi:hypothetical protein